MKVLAALWILWALAIPLAACGVVLLGDPEEPITFVNETDGTLWFYVPANMRAGLWGTDVVGPRSSLKWSIFGRRSYSWRVAATREDGQWVFDRTYSEEEWKKAGGRVVVSSLTPIAPPSDVDVVPRVDAPRPLFPSGRLPPPRPTPGR